MMSAVDDTAWTQRKLKGWISDWKVISLSLAVVSNLTRILLFLSTDLVSRWYD